MYQEGMVGYVESHKRRSLIGSGRVASLMQRANRNVTERSKVGCTAELQAPANLTFAVERMDYRDYWL